MGDSDNKSGKRKDTGRSRQSRPNTIGTSKGNESKSWIGESKSQREGFNKAAEINPRPVIVKPKK